MSGNEIYNNYIPYIFTLTAFIQKELSCGLAKYFRQAVIPLFFNIKCIKGIKRKDKKKEILVIQQREHSIVAVVVVRGSGSAVDSVACNVLGKGFEANPEPHRIASLHIASHRTKLNRTELSRKKHTERQRGRETEKAFWRNNGTSVTVFHYRKPNWKSVLGCHSKLLAQMSDNA